LENEKDEKEESNENRIFPITYLLYVIDVSKFLYIDVSILSTIHNMS
jgi:hypothetical protein